MMWLSRSSSVVLALTLGASACRMAPPLPSPAAVYQRVSASSVVVDTDRGSGSGTVILSRPRTLLVLTAAHVVAGSRRIRILRHVEHEDETWAVDLPASVVHRDEARDLALLRASDGLPVPALPVAHAEPELYEPLFVLAAPMGLPGTAAPAVLSSKDLPEPELWQITGLVFFGSSGGTVTNAAGELVAVPVRVAEWSGFPVSQIGYCVGLPDIRAFLADAAASPLLEASDE